MRPGAVAVSSPGRRGSAGNQWCDAPRAGSGNAAASIDVATKKHRSCRTLVWRSSCRAAIPPRHKKWPWLAFGMEPERGMARLDGAGWGVLMKNEIRIVPQAAERSRRSDRRSPSSTGAARGAPASSTQTADRRIPPPNARDWPPTRSNASPVSICFLKAPPPPYSITILCPVARSN